ncbi:MAG: MFS transporter, partial [Pontixanthobacter sp.]
MLANAVSVQLSYYVLTLFVPSLISEFGWSKAEVALTTAMGAIGLVAFTVAGRLADRFGSRRTAWIGVLGLPAGYCALSFMTGDIRQFYALYMLVITLGATTSAAVYGRVIAARFETSRGLAFALVLTCVPVTAAVVVPALEHIIATSGWRWGFRALAIGVLACGVLALSFMPGELPLAADRVRPDARAAFRIVFRSRAFWLIAGGMALCNIGTALNTLQLKPMLLENGVSTAAAARLMSAFAIGVVVGRMVSGFALDRINTHVFAALA